MSARKRESKGEPAPKYEGWEEVLVEVEREKHATVDRALAATVVRNLALIREKITPMNAASRAIELSGVQFKPGDTQSIALWSLAKKLRQRAQNAKAVAAAPAAPVQNDPLHGVFTPEEWNRLKKQMLIDRLQMDRKSKDILLNDDQTEEA